MCLSLTLEVTRPLRVCYWAPALSSSVQPVCTASFPPRQYGFSCIIISKETGPAAQTTFSSWAATYNYSNSAFIRWIHQPVTSQMTFLFPQQPKTFSSVSLDRKKQHLSFQRSVKSLWGHYLYVLLLVTDQYVTIIKHKPNQIFSFSEPIRVLDG